MRSRISQVRIRLILVFIRKTRDRLLACGLLLGRIRVLAADDRNSNHRIRGEM
jgi:hypothetical protein